MPRFRPQSELVRDRKEIARRYLQGEKQVEIAEAMGMSQPTVSRDIKALLKQWQRDALTDIGIIKARELERINVIEMEAWAAWEASKGTVIKRREQRKIGGDTKEYLVEQHQGFGDPRYLAVIQWCVERRVKIFGLDEPTTVILDWRDEARQMGLDPDAIVNPLVDEFLGILEGASNGGSVEAG